TPRPIPKGTRLPELEPFDLRALRRYDPSFISGWLAEEPSRSKDDCFQLSHDESVEQGSPDNLF
ncbi:MAG: hypothetical protein ACKVII_27910, partial [Planctomycetales bacterium]